MPYLFFAVRSSGTCFFFLATGKLNVFIHHKKTLPSGRNAKKKRKNSKEAEEVQRMPRCKDNPPESPDASTRTQNTNFDNAKNKKSDGENELDENEMIADGKLF